MIGQKRFIALLLDAKDRDAGTMEKDGKTYSWGAGYQLITISLGENLIKKYMVDENCVKKIQAQLESVHWGCAIELKVRNKRVVEIAIIEDVLKGFFDEN